MDKTENACPVDNDCESCEVNDKCKIYSRQQELLKAAEKKFPTIIIIVMVCWYLTMFSLGFVECMAYTHTIHHNKINPSYVTYATVSMAIPEKHGFRIGCLYYKLTRQEELYNESRLTTNDPIIDIWEKPIT